jgi:hypothetical protein
MAVAHDDARAVPKRPVAARATSATGAIIHAMQLRPAEPLAQDASRCLVRLARRNAQIYVARCAPLAILLTGSSASGNADFYSDIDMIAYYAAALPSEDQLQAARDDIGAESFRESYPRWEDHTCGETYQVGSVECQVGHKVVADLEERTLSLLDGHDPADFGMKAIMGLLSGIPLHGDEIIEAWQAPAANFSDRLARGMIEHYLRKILSLAVLRQGDGAA